MAADDEAPPTIAVLCPAPRLRRILRLVLEADGYSVVDWDAAGGPPCRVPSAVIADLDSLGWSAPEVVGRLSAVGLVPTPVLLISVYPHARNGLAYLQPPFGPAELVACVRRLLHGRGARL